MAVETRSIEKADAPRRIRTVTARGLILNPGLVGLKFLGGVMAARQAIIDVLSHTGPFEASCWRDASAWESAK
ncbi:MAG TPA: hypothetical protein PLM14_16750 [Candidatus Hydrogenedentes bacterium]|nr:hypothetical protein [Candidatus Hydrogenedentota bacterium]HQH54687.1 hypothetical protein [Candidatus Hydrogenedentota bacterium]